MHVDLASERSIDRSMERWINGAMNKQAMIKQDTTTVPAASRTLKEGPRLTALALADKTALILDVCRAAHRQTFRSGTSARAHACPQVRARAHRLKALGYTIMGVYVRPPREQAGFVLQAITKLRSYGSCSTARINADTCKRFWAITV